MWCVTIIADLIVRPPIKRAWPPLYREMFFHSGDGRVNEHHSLSIFHTIFHREHNRIEEILHLRHPNWDGEKLYQESRKIVGAELQHITYKEFLPAILGSKGIKDYDLEVLDSGYFTGTAQVYCTWISFVLHALVHFRLWSNDWCHHCKQLCYCHLQVWAQHSSKFHGTNGQLMESRFPAKLLHQSGSPTVRTLLNLHIDSHIGDFLVVLKQFFLPKPLYNVDEDGIDAFLRGIVDQRSEKCDQNLPVEVTNHLLTLDGKTLTREKSDLFSLNTRRGWDHGLPGQWNETKVIHEFGCFSVSFSAFLPRL